jgi:hypothetical protein
MMEQDGKAGVGEEGYKKNFDFYEGTMFKQLSILLRGLGTWT